MSYVSIICQCLAQDILIDPITDLLVRFLSLSQKLKLCVWSHCKFQSPLDLHPKRTTTISIARFRSTPPSVHVTLSDPQHAPPTLPTPIHMHPHKHAHTPARACTHHHNSSCFPDSGDPGLVYPSPDVFRPLFHPAQPWTAPPSGQDHLRLFDLPRYVPRVNPAARIKARETKDGAAVTGSRWILRRGSWSVSSKAFLAVTYKSFSPFVIFLVNLLQEQQLSSRLLGYYYKECYFVFRFHFRVAINPFLNSFWI